MNSLNDADESVTNMPKCQWRWVDTGQKLVRKRSNVIWLKILLKWCTNVAKNGTKTEEK